LFRLDQQFFLIGLRCSLAVGKGKCYALRSSDLLVGRPQVTCLCTDERNRPRDSNPLNGFWFSIFCGVSFIVPPILCISLRGVLCPRRRFLFFLIISVQRRLSLCPPSGVCAFFSFCEVSHAHFPVVLRVFSSSFRPRFTSCVVRHG